MKFENKLICEPNPVMTYHLIDSSFVRTAETKEGNIHQLVFSTEIMDRHQTIKRVNGAQLKNFKANPVYLWAHNVRNEFPPIGTVKKLIKKNDPNRLVGGTLFDQEDEFARFIESKFIRGFLNATSIGFIPLEWESITEHNKDKGKDELIGYDIIKYELLEASAVPVPSDFKALKEDRQFFKDMEWERYIEEFHYPLPKGWEKRTIIVFDSEKEKNENIDFEDECTQYFEGEDQVIRIDMRKVISYKAFPTADEGYSWDASRAKKNLAKWAGGPDKDKISWSKYGQGFGWVDTENAESFGAYKLPHHDVIDGSVKTIWRGVAAAMAALLGARGGVDIPENDKRGVYSHLKKHYDQFDKEAPEYREYEFDELIEMYLRDLSEDEWKFLLDKIFEKEKDERLIELMNDNPREKLNDFLQKISRFLNVVQLAELVQTIEQSERK